MLSAYILINCTLGSEQNIIKGLAPLAEVKEVRGIYGIHDIYTKVKTEDIESLNKSSNDNINYYHGSY